MDKDTALNLLRSFLKLAGASLAAQGFLTGTDADAIVGGIVAVVGVVWSLVAHKQKAAALAAQANQK